LGQLAGRTIGGKGGINRSVTLFVGGVVIVQTGVTMYLVSRFLEMTRGSVSRDG
jgi:hypothetical protein